MMMTMKYARASRHRQKSVAVQPFTIWMINLKSPSRDGWNMELAAYLVTL